MPLKGNSSTGIAEAGCDEAGRGCLAGPVVAAAVILPDEVDIEGLNDSKQLRPAKREELKSLIEKKATAWAVAFVHPAEIDEINILNASFLAMHRALDQLKIVPDCLLIDGNRFNPYKGIPHRCIIKGDASHLSIAAASILAKTYRDEYMERIGREFPGYNWQKNKGYPTEDHRNAIRTLGACIHHRKSFTLLPPQLKLDL